MSAGNYYQLNRRFNEKFNLTIYQLYTYKTTYVLINDDEYMQILTNAWSVQHFVEADFRAWVVAGYITAEQFTTITGIAYTQPE
jgi:hypothetical protein